MKITWTNKSSVLRAIKKAPGIFDEEFKDGLTLIGDLLVTSIVAKTPVGGGSGPWGHLSNSIQAGEPARSVNGMAISVGTPAEYAEVIEHGRTPGGPMPPVREIAVWVWENRDRFPDVRTEKDALAIAFPIAKSIAKNGFKSAAEGPGKGWGMFGRAMKEDIGKIEAVTAAMKLRIETRVTGAFGGN